MRKILPFSQQDATQKLLSAKRPDAAAFITRWSKKVAALSTPLGQQLIEDVLVQVETLFTKIANETATDIERADYRAYRRQLDRWADIIHSYMAAAGQITEG